MDYGQRDCKQCGKTFTKREPLQYVCGIACAIARAKFLESQKQDKEWKVKKKEGIEAAKTPSQWKKGLQAEINAMARLIDFGQPCMMCGNPKMKRIYGCHYHAVGSNASLRFNLLNIWGGCFSCNNAKSGNIPGYDKQLIKEFGRDLWEEIKFDLVREFDIINLSIPEIKEATTKVRGYNRHLKKLGLVYTNNQRVDLRIKYNQKIGIYVYGD